MAANQDADGDTPSEKFLLALRAILATDGHAIEKIQFVVDEMDLRIEIKMLIRQNMTNMIRASLKTVFNKAFESLTKVMNAENKDFEKTLVN